MKPLQAVAMGLVVVLLTAPVHGYDLLPDPIGWALVLVGLAALHLPTGATVTRLAGVALVVSVPVWVPGVRDRLNLTDASLAWAASLPELLTVFLLAHSLARAARAAGDVDARRWLLTARTLTVVAALLPPVVLGGGVGSLDGVATLVGDLSLVLVVVLLFVYADRPWARPVDEPD